MSAETHLAKFGITTQQAIDFINSNVLEPGEIYDTAFDYGVTTGMLSELSGYSVDVVRTYFNNTGEIWEKLDNTSILINYDLNSLESLISMNERDGLLSNDSLRNLVLPKVEDDLPTAYDPSFNWAKPYQDDDNIYDAEELGVFSLASVSATTKSVESLFYGSLINIFSRLDDAELIQINEFPNKESKEYQLLLFTVLDSPSAVSRNDTDLIALVVAEAVNTINSYWSGEDPDTGVVDYRIGILDYSLLGNL